MGPSRACRPCYAPPPREEFPKENLTEHDRCGSQVVRQRIANPLHVGSNPIRTSTENSEAFGKPKAPFSKPRASLRCRKSR